MKNYDDIESAGIVPDDLADTLGAIDRYLLTEMITRACRARDSVRRNQSRAYEQAMSWPYLPFNGTPDRRI
ncbi:MAG: hypothetical protein ABIQ57_15100 [Candidatus Kapaibacterium sp.]